MIWEMELSKIDSSEIEVSKDAKDWFKTAIANLDQSFSHMQIAVDACRKISNAEWSKLVSPCTRSQKHRLKKLRDVADSKVYIKIASVAGYFAHNARRLPYEVQEQVCEEGLRMPVFDQNNKHISSVIRFPWDMSTQEMKMAIDTEKNKLRTEKQMVTWHQKEMKAITLADDKPKGKIIDTVWYEASTKGVKLKRKGVVPWAEILEMAKHYEELK